MDAKAIQTHQQCKFALQGRFETAPACQNHETLELFGTIVGIIFGKMSEKKHAKIDGEQVWKIMQRGAESDAIRSSKWIPKASF